VAEALVEAGADIHALSMEIGTNQLISPVALCRRLHGKAQATVLELAAKNREVPSSSAIKESPEPGDQNPPARGAEVSKVENPDARARGVDYSKWDALDVRDSNSEEEEEEEEEEEHAENMSNAEGEQMGVRKPKFSKNEATA
jgi:hypothetical protein